MPANISHLLTRKTIAIANLKKQISQLADDFELLQDSLSLEKNKSPEKYRDLFVLEGHIVNLISVLFDIISMDDSLSAKSFKINIPKIHQLEVATILNSCFHNNFGTDLLKQANEIPDSILTEQDYQAHDRKEIKTNRAACRQLALLKDDTPPIQGIKPSKRSREFTVIPHQVKCPIRTMSTALLLDKLMDTSSVEKSKPSPK